MVAGVGARQSVPMETRRGARGLSALGTGDEGEVLAHQEDGRHRLDFSVVDGRIVTSPAEGSPRRKGPLGALEGLFLPAGYPDSVSPDYLRTRKYCWAHNIFSSAIVFFNTQFVLASVGVALPDPAAAALGWTLRQWIGGLGKFAGAHLAGRVDQDPKNWYAVGKGVFQAGMVGEAALALAPGAFLPIAIGSQVVKSAGDTLVAASQANIERHFARAGNMGEVRARNGNQDTVMDGIGTAMALAIQAGLKATQAGPAGLAAAYGVLAAGSLLMAWQASRALDMRVPSPQKMVELAGRYLDSGQAGTPEEFDRSLGLLASMTGSFGHRVQMAAGLEGLRDRPETMRRLVDLFADKDYLVYQDEGSTRVVFRPTATPETVAEAALVVARLERRLQGRKDPEDAAVLEALEESLRSLPEHQGFARSLREAGWELDSCTVPSGVRAEWGAALVRAQAPPALGPAAQERPLPGLSGADSLWSAERLAGLAVPA